MVIDEVILKTAKKMVMEMTEGEEKKIPKTPFFLVSEKKEGDIPLQKIGDFVLVQRGR